MHALYSFPVFFLGEVGVGVGVIFGIGVDLQQIVKHPAVVLI